MRANRLRRNNFYRYTGYTIFTILVWSAIDIITVQRALSREERQPAHSENKKIFIASILWNAETILRSHWMSAVVDLVSELGPTNVFVSIHESGSWDNAKEALRDLNAELEKIGVRRKIVLDPTTHLHEINKPPSDSGWIWTPREKLELRRIPYLARLRNLAMEPLHEMRRSGESFDKILFLGDVVFNTRDIRNLLATHGGEYAAACSLDFSTPPQFYDTFALRDSNGYDYLSYTWPYFRARKSRRALKGNKAVPVSSCWNGIVVMDTAPFYRDNLTFRGIPDSLAAKHIEGSECCLIHADNPLSLIKGVWLNPDVRVGYSGEAHDAVNPKGLWLSSLDISRGLWKNRISRWFTTTWFKGRIVARRLAAWKSSNPAHEERQETFV